MNTKEELRKKFDKFMNSAETLTPSRSRIFDFFYAEIEAREKFKTYVHARLDKSGVPENPDPENNAKHGCRIEGRLNFLEAKISHLQDTLEAAQNVIDSIPSFDYEDDDGQPDMSELIADRFEREEKDFNEALEKYQQLKTKSQS